jgi:hypothetical protein
MSDEEIEKIHDEPDSREGFYAYSAPDSSKARFHELSKRLKRLKDLKPGWDSYDAQPPNATAFALAEIVFSVLIEVNFPPTNILASVEGGIGFVFHEKDKYADIECFNSGNIASVSYSNVIKPQAWVVDPGSEGIKESITKIRSFLNA